MHFSTKIIGLFCSLFLSFSTAARPVTDDNGHTVDLPESVNRVVVTNILPLASAIAVFHRSADKIIGIHPASRSAAENGLLGKIYPEILKADYSFIKGASLDIEALLALEPDIVFVNAADERMLSAVRNAGMNAFAVSAKSDNYDPLETYRSWFEDLSRIWPEKALENDIIFKRTKETAHMIAERTAGLPADDRARVLFLYRYENGRIVTSGRRFFGEHWCRHTGSINAASSVTAQTTDALVSMEDIYAWDPEVIFITNFTRTSPEDLLRKKPGYDDWSPVSAVRTKRVYKMPLGIYRSFTPSADSPIILLWLAKMAYPNLFSDIDIQKEVVAYYKDVFDVNLTPADVSLFFNPKPEAGSGVRIR